MAIPRQRHADRRSPGDWIPNALIGITWIVIALILASSRDLRGGVLAFLLIAAALGVTLAILRLDEQRRWSRPIHRLALQLTALAEDPSQPLELTTATGLDELGRALSELQRSWLEAS